MQHKTTPRGGATNQSRDLIDQGMEELQEEEKTDGRHGSQSDDIETRQG